jgi:hypothetical protein
MVKVKKKIKNNLLDGEKPKLYAQLGIKYT